MSDASSGRGGRGDWGKGLVMSDVRDDTQSIISIKGHDRVHRRTEGGGGKGGRGSGVFR